MASREAYMKKLGPLISSFMLPLLEKLFGEKDMLAFLPTDRSSALVLTPLPKRMGVWVL
jgi:hypothetical protein